MIKLSLFRYEDSFFLYTLWYQNLKSYDTDNLKLKGSTERVLVKIMV